MNANFIVIAAIRSKLERYVNCLSVIEIERLPSWISGFMLVVYVGYLILMGVFFLSLTEDDMQLFLVMVSGCVSVGKIGDSEIFRLTQASFINLRSPIPDDDKISEVCSMISDFLHMKGIACNELNPLQVKKVLNSGTFYFSWSSSTEPIDLTLCEQKRTFTKETDNRFFW